MANTSKLAQEGYIGKMKLKNRIVMPPMGTGLANINGEVTPQMIEYYSERARGGAGLIIVEIACVDSPVGMAGLTQLRIDNPKYIPGLNELAEAITSYGCKSMIQLHHAGRQTSPAVTGKKPVAPSPVACRLMQVVPEELSIEGIKDIQQKFVNAALFAHSAGFDGIELHAAHGYLLSQFLSPYSNLREDEYGGSPRNRARLLLDIISDIKNWIPDLAVSVRLNMSDFVRGGLELPGGLEVARLLEAAGADVINVSAGIYESGQISIEPASFSEGWRIYLAEAVKAQVNIPVIAGGVIRHPAVAEDIIKHGKADFVWVGRGMLADPKWASKAINGEDDQIRPCISCNNCIARSFAGLHIRCAVNPYATREWKLGTVNGLENTRVLIIGGGPAGMQAALTLTQAGCQVTLLEKQDRLGGQLHIAAAPPYKDKIGWLLEYLDRKVTASNIDVHLQTEFKMECLERFSPDTVIVATGAQAFQPDLPGAINKLVIPLDEILSGSHNLSGKKVVIIGGGSTGCELAEYLLDRDNQVTIIEQENQLAQGLENMSRLDLLLRLKKKGVNKKTQCTVKSIEKNGVIITKTGRNEPEFLQADQVVFACGYRSEQSLYYELKNKIEELYVIGDASQARDIKSAMYEAVMVAYQMSSRRLNRD